MDIEQQNINIPFQITYSMEYHELARENNNMKNEIARLINNEKILHDVITNKNKTIEDLRKENAELKNRLNLIEKQLKILSENNIQQIQKYDTLKNEHDILKNEHDILKNNFVQNAEEKILIESLAKLNDCDKLANDSFKKEYRKYFNLGKWDKSVPNIGDFVNDPPNVIDGGDFFVLGIFLQKISRI